MTVFALAACSNDETPKEISDPNENVEWVLIPMIYVNDDLYLYSGEEKYYDEVTDFDGEIDYEVEQTLKPTKNNQSNFGTGFKFKIIDNGKSIEVYLDDNNIMVFVKEEDKNK